MKRTALFTLSLAIVPAMAVAQQPPLPPAPPARIAAPVPAPAPLPRPAPVIADFPADIHVDGFTFEGIDIGPIDVQVDVARIQAEVSRATADLGREAAMMAREAANLARQDMKFEFAMGDAYNAGLNALQQRQYDKALTAFDRVIAAKGTRVDAALYWKAFAEFRMGRTDAALRTIADLRRDHAASRYQNDARVLETEVRKQSGQPVDPAQLDNDDIKLLAIQGLQRTEQVVPLLEGVLNGANSLGVKKRALYVLALGTDPRAREILLRYAKGGGNPDLQIEAIRLLVSRRDPQTTGAVLRDLYDSATDVTVRRTIIDAYGVFRQRDAERGRTVSAEQTGGLNAASAPQELLALYQKETDAGLKRHIASVLASIGAIDQVITLVKAEREPAARRGLIGVLGGRRSEQVTTALTALYRSSNEADTKNRIISTLAGQQGAEALIALARTESDIKLKTTIVRHLSEMAPRSKPAADYLMDVIK